MTKSNLKIRTSFVTQGNMEALTKSEWLPVFIIRSIKNSQIIGKYDGTPIHLYWLAPRPQLFHRWRDKEISFEEYSKQYSKDIQDSVGFSSLISRLEILRQTSGAKGIVLMGYGEDVNNCHRGILAKMINESGILEEPIKEFII